MNEGERHAARLAVPAGSAVPGVMLGSFARS
jgi:hypothetical protein